MASTEPSYCRGDGHDWCEDNYVYSSHVAEMYNVLSNLPFLGLGFLGLYYCWRYRYEQKYAWSFVTMLALGVGGMIHHATLAPWSIIIDELPTLISTGLYFYISVEVFDTLKYGWKLPALITVVSIAVVVVYYATGDISAVQITYVVETIALAVKSGIIIDQVEKQCKPPKKKDPNAVPGRWKRFKQWWLLRLRLRQAASQQQHPLEDQTELTQVTAVRRSSTPMNAAHLTKRTSVSTAVSGRSETDANSATGVNLANDTPMETPEQDDERSERERELAIAEGKRHLRATKLLTIASTIPFILSLVAFAVDKEMCCGDSMFGFIHFNTGWQGLHYTKGQIGYPWRVLLELHAQWHVLEAISMYNFVMTMVYVRDCMMVRPRGVVLKWWIGTYAYIEMLDQQRSATPALELGEGDLDGANMSKAPSMQQMDRKVSLEDL
ncbi:hypothetical protein RI367_001289 [Sorochytrium milnesiophthora]